MYKSSRRPDSPGRSRRTFALAAATAATALTALSLTGGTAAAAASQPVPNSVPGWATSTNAVGTPATDTTVEGQIYLPLRNEAKAQALATAVSTPGNAKYGKYLTPQQWINTYSPSTTDYQAILDFVTSQGLTVTGTPASRQYVVFRGPAELINAAFSTTLKTYRYKGENLIAPATAPKVPVAVKADVSGVTLDQGRQLTRPSSVKPEPKGGAAGRAVPSADQPAAAQCSNYWAQNTATVPQAYGSTTFPTFICGYLPGQLRSAYGVSKLINAGQDGSGQTVAIVDAYASPTIVKDTNTYALKTGSAPLLPSTYTQIVPKVSDFVDVDACGGTEGWQGEQTLDVQSAHGIAPGAKILYVGGFNCGGGLDIALSKIMDRKLANIVSNSYGYAGEDVPPSVLRGEQNQHVQAAAEGIGLYFSSGDSGDEQARLGFVSPDFPASSPFVTSVGGTSLEIGKAGNYITETGWGSSLAQIKDGAYVTPPPGVFGFGAGGGVSDQFAQPAYQAGVVPDSLATAKGGAPARVSPDVASLADPYTGFRIGYRPITDDATQATGDFELATYGGTSLASPLTAAQVALAQQATGRTVGFANPAIYAGYRSGATVTRDVTPKTPAQALVYTSARTGNTFLVTLDRDSSLTTTKGYDTTTGLGSLDIAAIVAQLK